MDPCVFRRNNCFRYFYMYYVFFKLTKSDINKELGLFDYPPIYINNYIIILADQHSHHRAQHPTSYMHDVKKLARPTQIINIAQSLC